MDFKDVLAHEDLAVGTYRWAISQLIPHMTDVALKIHGKEIVDETPGFEKRKFLYRLRRADYEKSWGTKYQKPGLGTRFLAAILRIIPRFGPFKGLDFNVPTQQTEDLYIASINKTFEDYRALLEKTNTTAVPDLQDRNLDTGQPTEPAAYALADQAYARLLTQLADKKFAQTSPALRDNILGFYAHAAAPVKTKKNDVTWDRISAALDQLRAAQPAQVPIVDSSE
jgi:hypothetical protein